MKDEKALLLLVILNWITVGLLFLLIIVRYV